MIKICANCDNTFKANRDRAKFCSDICRASFHQVTKGENGEIIVKIYALVNPIDDSIFYIGKTIGTLEARLKTHLRYNDNIEKANIIEKIINKGLSPIIIELERHLCSTENEETTALMREDFWIKYYIEKGSALCNVQGVKSIIKPRLLTSYKKESEKSRPSGVRFDLEILNFIQKKEPNLTTKQKVVDFLLNKFWWENKVAIPNHKGLPPMVYDAPKVEKPIHDEPPMFSQPKVSQYDAYYIEIMECNSVGEIEAVVREIKKDTIPDWQKNKLEKIAIEKSKTFDF